MRCLQPTLTLVACIWSGALEARVLGGRKYIPWDSVRNLFGNNDVNLYAAGPASAPMVPAPSAASGPAAVPNDPVEVAPTKSPCPPCPEPAPVPGNTSVQNQDLVDVARDEAVETVEDTSENAKHDTQYSIEQAGRNNLRGVQEANNQAVDQAGASLKAHTDAVGDQIVSDVNIAGAMGRQEMDMNAHRTQYATTDHIDKAARQTMAHYINAARTQLADLNKEIQKSGKQSIADMQNAVSVSTEVHTMLEKYVTDAEVKANESSQVWANTQRVVRKAQIEANHTEDSVRTSAIGTKFSTQAVQHAKEESNNAFDMATQANLTGNMIIKKVMATKAGIETVTAEVFDALTKASKANIDAHQADMVATKLNHDAQATMS